MRHTVPLALRRICLAAAFLACAAVPASAASLVGIWLGHGQPTEGDFVYLNEIRADGTFRSEFRKYERCALTHTSVETGRWTLKDNVQEMITQQVDGRPINFSNLYTIELLTETEQHARQQKNGHLYVERRVQSFEFPPCREAP